jgi:O-antigen/teichoic acid export membrane protein
VNDVVATLSADHDPREEAEVDILDTAEAGPSVIRGSLLRLSAYLLGTLATVASSAVVIRHLGVINTGRYITVTAIVLIVLTVSDLGVTGIAVRDYSSGPKGDRQRLLANLLGIRMTIAVGGLIIAVLFTVAVGYPLVMVIGTVIAGLGTLGLVVQDACAIPLQVGLRFGWVAGLQLAIQAGVAIEAVLLALAGAGLLPFFATQIPIVLPALFVTVLVSGRDVRVLPTIDTKRWRQMLGRILPFSGAVVLSVIYFQIAQIMVSLISNAHQTGYFGVAFRVLVSFTALPPLLVSTALPMLARAARDDSERFDYASRRLAETMLLAGCGLALALFLGARFAVDVVAGAHFGHSVEVLRILAVALLGTFVIGARGYALLSLDRLRAMLACNALALVVVVVAGVPLISVYGAKGAAIGMVAAELTLAAGYEYSLTRGRRELGLGLGFVLRAAAATVAAAAVALGLGLTPVIAATLGLALYLAALLALGIVPDEIRQALLHRRRPAGGT